MSILWCSNLSLMLMRARLLLYLSEYSLFQRDENRHIWVSELFPNMSELIREEMEQYVSNQDYEVECQGNLTQVGG